jgi:hypothetical protein
LKQRTPASSACLADAGEHHFRCRRTDRQHARQFAAADDVEAAAQLGEDLQHGQVRVGLHRVAQQVLAADQRTLVRRGGFAHRGA